MPKKNYNTTPARLQQTSADRPLFTESGLRHALLGLVTAVCVARPLLPSESVATEGYGVGFVILLLLAMAIWLMGCGTRGGLKVRLGAADLAMVFFLALHTLSSVWSLQFGAPRPALNMLWEWLGMALIYFLLRQWLQTAAETRTLVVVMVALAGAVACEGFYRFAVTSPSERALYYKDKDLAIAEMGLDAPEGSQARWALEQRLNSTEPTATFALTNSLAGFLLPWLIVALGLALFATSSSAATTPASAPAPAPVEGRWLWRWLLLCIPIGICLLMTKSRSAVGAGALGMLLMFVAAWRQRLRISWKFPITTAVLLAVTVCGLLAVGVLDREVFTESLKSFGYRWQYWQGALLLIADRPWLGCGDGNFQSFYLRYKLPTASEEVADPHSFILEIGSTAGVPALLAFFALLAMVFWQCVQNSRRAADESLKAGEASADPLPKHLLWGAAGGWLLALSLGQLADVPLSIEAWARGLFCSGVIVAVLWPWMSRGKLPVAIPLVAIATLLVNLLAAGGIGFPGVATSLWMLLAVSLAINSSHSTRQLPAGAVWSWLAVAAVTVGACYFSAYKPVLASRSAMHAAAEIQRTTPDRRAVLELLEQARLADPWSMDPPLQLALQHFADWERTRSATSFDEFEQNAHQALILNPQSSILCREIAERYRRAFAFTKQKVHLERAVELHQRGVELYPNKASQRAYLALVYQLDGQASAAQQQAERAFELDQLTPHVDQKLPNNLRLELQRLFPQSTPNAAALPAAAN